MPMSTIENTGQMVSFHVLSRQNLPSLWHSHLHVDSWCPRNSSSSASSANSATASKSILSWCLNRRKNSFYNRGAFGVGQSTNWFPPGFFQVWIFGGGCFMFKHPHEETIEKIERFEAVLNFSVVISFLATALFLKKHRWTSQICQRSADFILRQDLYVGPFAIKHPNNISVEKCRISARPKPNLQSYTSPLVIPKLFCISTPYHEQSIHPTAKLCHSAVWGFCNQAARFAQGLEETNDWTRHWPCHWLPFNMGHLAPWPVILKESWDSKKISRCTGATKILTHPWHQC